MNHFNASLSLLLSLFGGYTICLKYFEFFEYSQYLSIWFFPGVSRLNFECFYVFESFGSFKSF